MKSVDNINYKNLIKYLILLLLKYKYKVVSPKKNIHCRFLFRSEKQNTLNIFLVKKILHFNDLHYFVFFRN